MSFEIEGWPFWERQFARFLATQAAADVAHDSGHIGRVVAAARSLALAEGAEPAVVLPAAWLHDCVSVPKDSPLRAQASRLAAEAATAFLAEIGYPAEHLAPIAHAIEAHSFSANLAPATLEARVVQDADRLDALGAVGIARCLMLSGALGRRLYDPAEPFPRGRALDDTLNTIDHFYCKLLGLAERMQTAAGRAEAERRTAAMRAFLDQLESELPPVL
ncbi:MAG TPA: HD domain-containing protein [Herpetosiphonaceae bacterium]|nr:HD domain-containing protein [Herpetosiphonaceae bacterium]